MSTEAELNALTEHHALRLAKLEDALWLAMLAAQFDAACSAMDANPVLAQGRMIWPPDAELPQERRSFDGALKAVDCIWMPDRKPQQEREYHSYWYGYVIADNAMRAPVSRLRPFVVGLRSIWSMRCPI